MKKPASLIIGLDIIAKHTASTTNIAFKAWLIISTLSYSDELCKIFNGKSYNAFRIKAEVIEKCNSMK